MGYSYYRMKNRSGGVDYAVLVSLSIVAVKLYLRIINIFLDSSVALRNRLL
jgi:hypothetical protein